MTNKLNENSLAEQPVISWLKELGYDYESESGAWAGAVRATGLPAGIAYTAAGEFALAH